MAGMIRELVTAGPTPNDHVSPPFSGEARKRSGDVICGSVVLWNWKSNVLFSVLVPSFLRQGGREVGQRRRLAGKVTKAQFTELCCRNESANRRPPKSDEP